MNRKLSSRILLPNLVIVIGSLLLLFLAMLISVRVMMQKEAKWNFAKAKVTVEVLLQSGQADMDAAVQRIKLIAPMLLVDAKILLLTEDMKYPSDSTERPLDEAVFQEVDTDGGISDIRSGTTDYFVARIPYRSSNGAGNMLLYTSLVRIEGLIRQLALNMLLALAGASLIAVLASIYAAKRIADPLKKLSRWARAIGGRHYGQFSLRSGTAEIDYLADSLNGMVKRMEDYDAAQKVFLQNASHELRTPLMSIQGYAEGIKHGVFADTANAADIIVAESLRLSALVDDLLYLSKLEMMNDFYVFEPTQLGEVLGQCAQKLEGAAIKVGKKITLLPCPDAAVSGDGEKLLRAVMNLAGNCLRYAQSKVEIALSVSGGNAAITVGDDGPGFDPQDMQHLFTRFYKGKQGKYGLGLSIAKTIVEKHGGTVRAENKPGGGALFTVELPTV